MKNTSAAQFGAQSFHGNIPDAPKPAPKTNTQVIDQWDAKLGKFVSVRVELPSTTPEKQYYVTRHTEGWAVRFRPSTRTVVTARTKKEAALFAAALERMAASMTPFGLDSWIEEVL